MTSPVGTESPLEFWPASLSGFGVDLFVKRDDLIPFPLAGNKVRKLVRELAEVDIRNTTLLTVGAVNSNHCRTTAMLAARAGGSAHLILHGNSTSVSGRTTLGMLERLGATWETVDASDVAESLEAARRRLCSRVHFIAGGCHTPLGVKAYVDAVRELATQIETPPDFIYLASGTGATQAGIIAGCHELGWSSTRVVGVSVARDKQRGTQAVREALGWRGLEHLEVEFCSDYLAGGYGMTDARIEDARDRGWQAGLPLDGTYTAKAFAALLNEAKSPESLGRVLFWHTGGLNTQISMDIDHASAGG